MQGDGNLVLRNSNNSALWNSGTSGHAGAYARVQTDGNLVVKSSGGTTLWSTNNDESLDLLVPDGNKFVEAHMAPATYLAPGQELHNVRENNRLVMQKDGNLVLRNSFNKALWSAGTYHHSDAYLAFQGDGNMVVRSKTGKALWNSNTSGKPVDQLYMQTDGNLVIYGADGHAVWASHTVQGGLDATDTNSVTSPDRLNAGDSITSTNGKYSLNMQGDGNLVLRNSSNKAVWNTHTAGHSGGYLSMQNDGNLVLRSSSGKAIWSSGSWGHGKSVLIMHDGGKIGIYDAYGHATWSAH